MKLNTYLLFQGKITKSVEEKLTEIKARNHEEGSPRKLNPVKDSKESSSLSDSEELSESSISKTCGIVSTTEGEIYYLIWESVSFCIIYGFLHIRFYWEHYSSASKFGELSLKYFTVNIYWWLFYIIWFYLDVTLKKYTFYQVN